VELLQIGILSQSNISVYSSNLSISMSNVIDPGQRHINLNFNSTFPYLAMKV